jgi:hypothetical protein
MCLFFSYRTKTVHFSLGPYITHSPVALPFHPIQGKRQERLYDVLPIKTPEKKIEQLGQDS